jgi:predicted enzyme related to lactoylglutathione lyase
MILGLRTCVYHVPPDQLARAKEWYARVAGVAPYYDTPYYVGFNVGGFELGVHPGGETPGPGGAVSYWGTADIAAEVARLKHLGATEVEAIQDTGEGIKVATLADPFGNLIGVIENPQFNPAAVR